MRSQAMNARELVLIGCFGAVGAALEISIGTLLHTFRVVPFKGLLMASILVVLFVASRLFIGRRSAPFLVGAVVAALKMLSPGAGFLTVVTAILMEGLVVSLVLAAGSARRPILPILAGVGTALYTIAHKFLINGLIMGSKVIELYLSVLEDVSVLLGLAPSDSLWLLVPLIALHVTVGGVAGFIGWKLGRHLLRVTHHESP
jgi:hypothetical protein